MKKSLYEAPEGKEKEEEEEEEDNKIENNDDKNDNDQENLNESIEEDEYEEFTIKLSMLYFDQYDPKKCTGKKMERLGLLKETKFSRNYGGILLAPVG